MRPVDQKIIKFLENNSRMSNSAIARKINVSEGTVRKRINYLTSNEVIKRFTIETKGMISAIVGLNGNSAVRTSEIIALLKDLGITMLYEVTGRFDILCMVKAESPEKTNEFIESIREIHGVQSTETFMILKQS